MVPPENSSINMPITLLDKQFQEKKSELKNSIDNKTNQLIAQGFQFDGNTFSLSLNAQNNFMGIKVATDGGLLTEADYPYEITTLDDKTYLLQWFNKELFFGAVLNAVATHLSSGRALKAQVNSSETQEQLDLVIDNR